MTKCISPFCTEDVYVLPSGLKHKLCKKHRESASNSQGSNNWLSKHQQVEYRCTNRQGTCEVCGDSIGKDDKRFRVPVFDGHPTHWLFHYDCLPIQCTKLFLSSTGPYNIDCAVEQARRGLIDKEIKVLETRLTELKRKRIDYEQDTESDDEEDAQPDMLFS